MISCRSILAIAGLLTLAGCGKPSADCSSAEASSAVSDMLKRSVEDEVRKLLEEGAELASFDRSKLSAALSKAQIELTEVRTTRDDPDSSRKFCDAKVSLKFSQAVIRVIDDARSVAGLEDRASVANRSGLRHDALGFSTELEYSVQPTDDGKKVIAESDGQISLVQALAELFSTYLLSDEIRAAKIESDQIEAKRLAEERSLAEQEEAARSQLAEASLEEAKAENRLAVQRIGAVWKAIPQSSRNRLAPIQTAWNKKISAQCTVEASSQSTDPKLVQAAKLRCETSSIFDRATELERFTFYKDNSAAGAAIDAAEAAAREAADAAAY